MKCPYTMLSPDSFSGGPRVPCTGVLTGELKGGFTGVGVIGGCGEPCSFVMDNISYVTTEELRAMSKPWSAPVESEIKRNPKDILEDKIRVLQRAKLAMTALEWCEETMEYLIRSKGIVSGEPFNISIYRGGAVDQGKAARHYLLIAFNGMAPELVGRMMALCREDIAEANKI